MLACCTWNRCHINSKESPENVATLRCQWRGPQEFLFSLCEVLGPSRSSPIVSVYFLYCMLRYRILRTWLTLLICVNKYITTPAVTRMRSPITFNAAVMIAVLNVHVEIFGLCTEIGLSAGPSRHMDGKKAVQELSLLKRPSAV